MYNKTAINSIIHTMLGTVSTISFRSYAK